jgi:hypothetical protein
VLADDPRASDNDKRHFSDKIGRLSDKTCQQLSLRTAPQMVRVDLLVMR